jgi:hypothetical protein
VVLLGDDAQVEARFDPFGECSNLDTRKVHVLRQIPQAQKSVWAHLMELIGDAGHVEARFGSFGDCANLDTIRCTFCAKYNWLRN